MKRFFISLLLFFVTFIYADCPSSGGFMGGTTKCKVKVNDVKVVENNNSDPYLEFTISLDDTAGKDIKIDFKTKDNTATTADNDYEEGKDTITIPKGEDSVIVKIKVYGDTKYEDNETIDFNISVNSDSDDDAEIEDGGGVGTIINDDPQMDEVYVKNKQVSESDGTIQVSIIAKGGANKSFDIDWKTADDTAKSNEDYDATNGTIHFDKGDTEKTISIKIKDDDVAEESEKFKIELSTSDDGVNTTDGYVTINESDKLIIVGDKYDSPESSENRNMPIIVRLKDPNEKAFNDIKINLKTDAGTATAGTDYDDINKNLTLKSGDNSVKTDVTIIDDEVEESNEDFNISLSCVDCGNLLIDEKEDKGTIIDNDKTKTLTNGEYNDVDNYYLRDDSGEKHYKRLFCTSLNTWFNNNSDDDTADNSWIRIQTKDGAKLTQIFDVGDINISYDKLYAPNIHDNNGEYKICKSGTSQCKTENLARLGDRMDVNESWFDVDGSEKGFVKKDFPRCQEKSIVLTNVDNDGNIIVWDADAQDGDINSCEINFTSKDFSKPFIIKGELKVVKNRGYDYSAIFNMDPGMYFIEKTKFQNEFFIHTNDERNRFWSQNSDYNITRIYIKQIDTGSNIDGTFQGYLFDVGSIINYEDCNNDGELNEDDISCQEPSHLLIWSRGLGGKGKDDLNFILKGKYLSFYLYNRGGYIGDDEKQSRAIFDNNNKVVFVGAINSFRINIDDDEAHNIYWKMPDHRYRFWLGDGDRCIYTPTIRIKGEDRKFKESEGSDADINLTIDYFTTGSQQSFCQNDWNVTFDYSISQRYSNDSDKEGNATQDIDYSAEKYSNTMIIKRRCSNCEDSSCWLPKQVAITDFEVKEDKASEPDELFDFNLSKVTNGYFEENNTLQHYIMTIIDVPAPKTLKGAYNAYDTNRADKNNDNSGKVGDDSNEDNNITTKIVGKKFTLTFGSFDLSDDSKLSIHKDGDGNAIQVKYGILSCPSSDTTDASECSKIYTSDKTTFNKKEVDKDFTIDTIAKYAAAFVSVCSQEKSDGNITLYQYDDCNGNTDCSDGKKCLRDVMSVDKFAIRPAKFIVSDIPDKVKAGEEFNVTITAVDASGNRVKNYNELFSVIDKNVTIYHQEEKAGCRNGVLLGDDKNFVDGKVKVSLKYDDIGKVDFKIKESDLSPVFASVDKGENRADNPISIEEATFSLSFIPDHFMVNSSFKNGTDFGTYISSDSNMSALLDLNISAVTKDNVITQNFDSNCYAKDVDVEINHSIPADIDTNLYFVIDKNKQEINKESSISYRIYKNSFTMGVSEIKHKINFIKNYQKPINPFDFNINSIFLKDEDISNSEKIDKNVTFLYGRVFYPKSFTSYLNEIQQSFTYQYFNNGWKKMAQHKLKDGNVSKIVSKRIVIELDNKVVDAVQNITESYNEGKRPYKEILHIDISSWLWYKPNAKNYITPKSGNLDCFTHPCMGILFLKNSNGEWAGDGVIRDVDSKTIKTKIKNHDTKNRDRSYIKVNW